MAGWGPHRDGYLAGVFDGEGTVTCAVYERMRGTAHAGWTQVRASVCMTDRAPLLLFALRFPGGSITRRVRNYPDAKRFPIWTWTIGGRKAIPALSFFAKHCILKGSQAALALEVIALLSEPIGKRYARVTKENLERRLAIAREVSRLKNVPVDDALGG